jgi:hypothetical protein
MDLAHPQLDVLIGQSGGDDKIATREHAADGDDVVGNGQVIQ